MLFPKARPAVGALALLAAAASLAAAQALWIDADGVRIVEPPAGHPRLYLTARDLPGLRRRMTHPVTRPYWEKLQAMAKLHTQIRIEVGALRYLLGRDPALGRRTIADALSLMRQFRIEGSANESRKIGRMMVTGAIVYDWIYPLLTADQKTEFIGRFAELAGKLECGYPPDKGSFVGGHPSEWMILRDMLSAGIATYNENPEMYRLAARRFFGSHVPARDWWYPGQAFHQGPGYADARFQSDMYPLWMFARMGAGNVFNRSQQFVPYEWIYLRRPDGQFLRSADGQNWPTRIGSLLAASYYRDGYILANYLKDPVIDPAGKLFYFLWPDSKEPLPAAGNMLWQFLWRDPDLKPLPLTDLPLSRYFGFPFGRMIARTGWDAQSVVAQMRVNIYNFAGHEHADAGDFALYYKGPLAIHSGVYQGVGGRGSFGSPHHRNYYQRTIAHNSLLIYDPDEKFGGPANPRGNDGGQRLLTEPRFLDDMLRGDHKTGEVLGHGFGPDPRKPEYTHLEGDITAAYTAKVKEVKRAFVFLNLNAKSEPAALIVFDRVVSANPAFPKYWLLQSVKEPEIEGANAVVALAGHGWSGKLVNTTVLPPADNAKIETIGGSGREFWVFGKNYPATKDPPDPEAGGWRVQISPRRPAAADLFLNVMQILDGSAKPLAVEKIESGQTLGVRLADRVVLFQASGRRAAPPVSFTVEGKGNLHFLVTGLEEGVWQVWRDGRIARPAVTVSGEDGALWFEGPPGAYELRR